jgi:hypothetical protein
MLLGGLTRLSARHDRTIILAGLTAGLVLIRVGQRNDVVAVALGRSQLL